MLVTGTDYVCLVAASDTQLASPVWLETVLTDGKYNAPYEGPQLWNDQYFNTIKRHSLKFRTGDTSQFSQLESWAESNTPLFIYLFGMDGGVQWEEGTVIRPTRDRVIKSLEPDYMEIQIAMSGIGLNIRARKNLLSSPVANGADASGLLFTVESGLTFVSTSKNGSFTLGSSPVYRITRTGSDWLVTKKAELNQKFPAKKGFTVQVSYDTYAGINNSDGFPGVMLTGYNSSGVSTETYIIGNGSYIMGRISGTYTFYSTATKYFKFSIVADETNSVNEFDNLVLCYGSAPTTFIDY